MKHNIYLILGLLMYSNVSMALQGLEPIGVPNNQKNTITVNDITINDINIFKTEMSLLMQHFGQPETVEDFYSETEDIIKKKYCYEGLVLYVVDNLIDSFEITGNTFSFTSNNIKVGDDIGILESIYPQSYSSKRFTSLGLDFEDIDGFVVIFFDFNNKITSIRNGG